MKQPQMARSQIEVLMNQSTFQDLDRTTLSKYLVYHCYLNSISKQPSTSIIEELLKLGADISFDQGLVLYISLIYSKAHNVIPLFLIEKGVDLDLDIGQFYSKSTFGLSIRNIFISEITNHYHNSFTNQSIHKSVENFLETSDIVIWFYSKSLDLLEVFIKKNVLKNIGRLMHLLVTYCDPVGLRMVLDAGHSVNTEFNVGGFKHTTSRKSNLLEYAIEGNNKEICEVLIEFGIEVEPTLDLLIHVIQKDNLVGIVAPYLMKKRGGDDFPKKDLVKMIKLNKPKVLRFFLENDLDPNCHKGVMLRTAIVKGLYEMITILLENGADATINDNEPIMACHSIFNPDIIVELVENGADPNARGGQALYYSIFHANHIVTRALLDLGADPRLSFRKYFLYNIEGFVADFGAESTMRIKRTITNHLRELEDFSLEV